MKKPCFNLCANIMQKFEEIKIFGLTKNISNLKILEQIKNFFEKETTKQKLFLNKYLVKSIFFYIQFLGYPCLNRTNTMTKCQHVKTFDFFKSNSLTSSVFMGTVLL